MSSAMHPIVICNIQVTSLIVLILLGACSCKRSIDRNRVDSASRCDSQSESSNACSSSGSSIEDVDCKCSCDECQDPKECCTQFCKQCTDVNPQPIIYMPYFVPVAYPTNECSSTTGDPTESSTSKSTTYTPTTYTPTTYTPTTPSTTEYPTTSPTESPTTTQRPTTSTTTETTTERTTRSTPFFDARAFMEQETSESEELVNAITKVTTPTEVSIANKAMLRLQRDHRYESEYETTKFTPIKVSTANKAMLRLQRDHRYEPEYETTKFAPTEVSISNKEMLRLQRDHRYESEYETTKFAVMTSEKASDWITYTRANLKIRELVWDDNVNMPLHAYDDAELKAHKSQWNFVATTNDPSYIRYRINEPRRQQQSRFNIKHDNYRRSTNDPYISNNIRTRYNRKTAPKKFSLRTLLNVKPHAKPKAITYDKPKSKPYLKSRRCDSPNCNFPDQRKDKKKIIYYVYREYPTQEWITRPITYRTATTYRPPVNPETKETPFREYQTQEKIVYYDEMPNNVNEQSTKENIRAGYEIYAPKEPIYVYEDKHESSNRDNEPDYDNDNEPYYRNSYDYHRPIKAPVITNELEIKIIK